MLRRVACGWLVASLCGGWLAQADGPAGSLVIRLGATERLPAHARQVMMAEAERLWTPAGLRLAWHLPSSEPADMTAAPPEVAAPLRVLVVERASSAAPGQGAWTVGQLLPLDTGGGTDEASLAIVSMAAAERVVERGQRAGEPDRLVTHRLGTVLGRTLAHEVGHYLLGTRTHARRGLMRARIAPDEFADLRDGGFTLDAEARQWLRRYWTRLEPAMPLAPRAGFSYPAR